MANDESGGCADMNPVHPANRDGFSFVIWVSSLIRHSSFGFRHFNAFVFIRG
jgi:hypothetical protein